MRPPGTVTECWAWENKHLIRAWLRENYGADGNRWGYDYETGIGNIWMNKDVYTAYLLRWT